MAKITIKQIEHQEKTSKTGKPYTSCRITVWNKKDNKDTFISGFGSGITKTWNVGDEVDVDLEQTAQGYWNFKEGANSKPSKDPILTILIEIRELLKASAMNNTVKTTELPTSAIKTPTNAPDEVKQTFQEEVEDLTKLFNNPTDPKKDIPDFLK